MNGNIKILVSSSTSETVFLTIHSAIELTEDRSFIQSDKLVDPFKSNERMFAFFVGNDNNVTIFADFPAAVDVNILFYSYNSSF